MMSAVDSTSGLRDRAWFERQLELQLVSCRERGEVAALVMLDVDGFRALIAERGELASDGVVRRIGRVLRGEVRPPGLAGRLGGDEFGVLLRGVRVDDVERVADRLRVVIGRPSPRPAGELVATVSVGVVVLDDRAPSAQEALAAAEAAVSVAKRRGCDRTVMV